MCESFTGSALALLLTAAHAALFANIVYAVYAAIIREIAAKGVQARFRKTDRGLFAYNAGGGR